MDQWATIFKQIYGKTPTKQDFSLAPESLRAALPKSNQKNNGGRSQKRKQLTIKMDAEFTSPKKLKKSCQSNGKQIKDKRKHDELGMLGQALVRPRVPPTFLSPVKQWSAFVASPNHKTLALASSPSSSSALFKTPSPARLSRRSVFCANIGQLLTPEKSNQIEEEEEPEENEEGVAEEEEEEDIDNDQIEEKPNQMDEEVKREERKKPKKKRKPVKKSADGNFVAINLRRKRFVPISKFNGMKGKKNWMKKKWESKRGTR